MTKTKVKAVGVLSGGLDSMLAVKVLQEQSVDIHGVHFVMPWEELEENKVVRLREKLGIPFTEISLGEDYLSMLRNPKYGYGTAFNPCVDCHTYMFKKAGEFGQTISADFIFTGEVLGQRPMSQNNRMLKVVAKNSGLEGRLLRPLSAKLLEPTMAEQDGLIDREKLLGISGRGRKDQIALAKGYGITNYVQPGGGCLLTEKVFGNRMKDVFEHGYQNFNDIKVLKLGRHFRILSKMKAILGRDENENDLLKKYADPQDHILELEDGRGPTLILKGESPSFEDLAIAAGFVQKFSRHQNELSIQVLFWRADQEEKIGRVESIKLTDQQIQNMLI